ncbi:MAG: polysaccharide biosynthesis/export family protein [Elainellaceae cyanobacterium]
MTTPQQNPAWFSSSCFVTTTEDRQCHRLLQKTCCRILVSTVAGLGIAVDLAQAPAVYGAAETVYLAQSAAPARPSAYALGAGDQIYIDVFDAPEYTGEYQVLSDGSISVPMVGVVQLSGLTLEGAASVLSTRLNAILRRPIVTVRLVSARPVTFAVAGQINRPGAYSLDPTTTDRVPTVTSAIQLAGGITAKANIRDVQVIRTDPRNQQPQQVFVADLGQLVQEGDLRQDIRLQDGDRIIIPEALDVVDLGRPRPNFSPDAITVNVVGEVSSPGSISVPPNTPLNQAILAAGGFSNRARKKRVELVRLNDNGSVTKREIEVDLTADASTGNNPLLLPNDTVIVNRSTLTRVSDTARQVVAPLGGVFALFRLFGF